MTYPSMILLSLTNSSAPWKTSEVTAPPSLTPQLNKSSSLLPDSPGRINTTVFMPLILVSSINMCEGPGETHSVSYFHQILLPPRNLWNSLEGKVSYQAGIILPYRMETGNNIDRYSIIKEAKTVSG